MPTGDGFTDEITVRLKVPITNTPQKFFRLKVTDMP